MKKINWQKTYHIDHEKGLFKLFISEHLNGHIYGSILYFTTEIDKNGHSNRLLDLQTFWGDNEEEVYTTCIQWVNRELSGEYEINEK